MGRNLLRSVAAAAVIVIQSAAFAQDSQPFISIATEDPFLNGQTLKGYDLHVFAGPTTTGSAGNALNVFGTDYTDNYILGGVIGRDFYDLGAGFVLGGVAGVAVRFGEDDETSGEAWAGGRIRHQGLVIGDLAISPGFTAGFSVVTTPTEIERQREIRYDGDATFLGYLGPELAFRLRQAPNVELIYQLHHRSGGDGTFGNMGEGSNANTLGLRYRF
jgi:hypothetical protein